MVKNTAPQSRVEWPASSQPRGVVRRRRESKLTYYNPKLFHRNIPVFTAPASAPEGPSSRPNVEVHQLAPPLGQSVSMEYLDYINFESSPNGFEPQQQFIPRDDQAETSWYTTSMVSYTLPIHPPNSPQSVKNGSCSPNNSPPATMYHNELQYPYQAAIPTPGNFIPNNVNNLSSPDRFGSFDSIDSMANSGSHTAASSISDSYVCPPSFRSHGSANLPDLALPGKFRA